MSRFLPYLSPFAEHIAVHPLFRVEARRSRWGSSARRLRQASVVRLVIGTLVTLVVWAVLSFPVMAFARQDPIRFAVAEAQEIYLMLLGLSFLSGGWLDFMSLSASAGAISREITTGRWDLLRLTALNDHGLVAAKHAAAQVSVWPRLMLIFGSRLALAVLGLWLYISTLFDFGQSLDGSSFTGERAVLLIASIGFTALLGLLYVLEPFWRVRAMTAFGVSVSVRERHAPSALLGAFFGTMGIWLLQSIVFGAVLLGSVFLIGFSTIQLAFSSGVFLVLCYSSIMIAVFVSAIYGFYHLLERWSLRRAFHRVSRLN